MECEYCLEEFKDKYCLISHQNTAKYCLKYKKVYFTCMQCNFKTVGIKNIEKHMVECNIQISTESQDCNLDTNQNNILLRIEKKIDFLLNSKISEKFSEDIITIPQQTNTCNETEENREQIFEIQSDVKNDSQDCIEEQVSPKSKKQKFKSLKNCINLRSEIPEEIKVVKIKEVNNVFENIKKSFNVFHEKIFSECFENIKQSRNYTKNIDILRQERTKLIKCLSIIEYTKLAEEHLKILQEIFKEKEYPEKKITTIIFKSMNSLDLRILKYSNYINTEFNIDEMQHFKMSLIYNQEMKPYYIPYMSKSFFEKFYNYSSIIFTIKDNIERNLFNPYNFNNIIYVPLKNSLENDPYSFYILESVNKEKRYWIMDCRLEDLTNNIINNIRPYLIKEFRKIYYDIFHDNEFRPDYMNTNSITEIDCEQLLQNIYILSNFKDFCALLRNIVKNNSTYIPTENDKFDFHGDDNIQKKRFANTKENSDVIDIIKLLFDNISSQEAVDFYRK
jgi:hypothetical protein